MKPLAFWNFLAVFLLLVAAWRLRGVAAFVYARHQAAAGAVTVAPAKPPSQPSNFAIVFNGDRRPDNLFYSSNGEPWQSVEKHRLRIDLGADAPIFDLDSFNTLTDYYKDGKLDFVRFYPVLPPVSYSTALSTMAQLLTKYGLHDRINWREYEQRLHVRTSSSDTYVPSVEFTAASLSVFLNCGWEYEPLPAAQTGQVRCGPYLEMSAKRERFPPAPHGHP